MVKNEIDKLFEFLYSPDKEIVELYARILFDKYDYDTIEEHVFNYKVKFMIIKKVRDAYHMYFNDIYNGTGFNRTFFIVYNFNIKSIIVNLCYSWRQKII